MVHLLIIVTRKAFNDEKSKVKIMQTASRLPG